MKKYLTIISIILTIFLAGCTNTKDSNGTNTSTKESGDSISSTNTNNFEKESNDPTLNKNTDDSKKVTETDTDKSQKVNETSKDNSKKSIQITASNSQITINEKSLDENSTFYFGMSKEDVISKLDKFKIKVENEIEISSSKDDPQYGNKQIWTQDISFTFNKENKLSVINIKENLPTSLGLKEGDSIEKLESLYGKNYSKYKTDNGFIYEYSINNYYFHVFLENEKVTEWEISKYKFLK
ncbi:hypothetical protein [uncultured Clostridium sp.]|uniref:hypothetical protein n=1 Tax=uncultured Clostridium sp. TaxID=59620 RepID=UPI0028EDD826|nr:hypothetical protein [uncultured Clostridium sp.]